MRFEMQNQMTQEVISDRVHLPVLVQAPANKPTASKEDVKYIHLRLYDRCKFDLQHSLKGSRLNPKGGATIAYLRKGDTVHFAFAQCNEKDVFNRKIGRNIARNRLMSGISDSAETEEKEIRSVLRKRLVDAYYDLESVWRTDVHLSIY